MDNQAAKTRRKVGQTGFTLLELIFTLTIAGILIGIGFVSWVTFAEARRVANTRSALAQIKNCLVSRIVMQNKYPIYSATPDCSNPDLERGVDICLCTVRDGWGNRIRFLEGVDAAGTGLSAGERHVAGKPAQGQTAVPLHGGSQSVDPSGKLRDQVVFVLISYGKDGSADDPSYGGILSGGALTGTLSITDPPDFSSPGDDLALIMSRNELIATFQ